ncbi:MAG: DNA polymerase III subunit epsilon [Rhodocyclales bacterium]|nr:DNA polymerase III subunit epsilon [Rhodocyclales bacterium]
MRHVVLDTETTGLEFRLGDRVIEIGCVELADRKLTGQRFHRYINPEREVEAGALAVHGLSTEFLLDKPKFAETVEPFLEFVRGAELIIHNAAFDVGFLNHELALLGLPPLDQVCAGVVDTLKLAKELHPGRRNSLDALCERYTIDNSGRTLHGALLDAELLAEVYLAMTRGQESLIIELDAEPAVAADGLHSDERLPLRVLRASAEELAEHERVLAEIAKESKGNCLWLAETPAAPA